MIVYDEDKPQWQSGCTPPDGERVIVFGMDIDSQSVKQDIVDMATWRDGKWECECSYIKVRAWSSIPNV